jgi:hypothetical protein
MHTYPDALFFPMIINRYHKEKVALPFTLKKYLKAKEEL